MENFKLNFLGKGSAFNIKDGNTSAFFIENNTLVLFDCGSTVFSKIIKEEILEEIDFVRIFITHMHTDHIGSLGDLVNYTKYIKKIPCKIYAPNNKMNNKIEKFLSLQGILVNNLDLNIETIGYGKFYIKDVYHAKINNYEISYREHYNHCPDTLNSFYIYIVNSITKEYQIYTGDTNCFPPMLNDYDFDKCKRIYIDCSINPDVKCHYYINDLKEYVEKINYPKSQITCMHFDSIDTIYHAIKYGFEIADIYYNNEAEDFKNEIY